METLLNDLMMFSEWIAENGETITVSVLAIIGWADKMALVLLKTMKNIKESYHDYKNGK